MVLIVIFGRWVPAYMHDIITNILFVEWNVGCHNALQEFTMANETGSVIL